MVAQLAMNATMTALGSLDQDGQIIVSRPDLLQLIRPFLTFDMVTAADHVVKPDHHSRQSLQRSILAFLAFLR